MKLTIQSGKETACVSPERVASDGVGEISEMFGTHDWDVDSGKPIGESGVIPHYNCKKCSAEGYSIIATKGTSTSTLIQNRVLNFV
jgi:hypothetical protein